MKVFAVLTTWALWVLPLLSLAEGVRYRGIFVNDEDWGLRPWAVRHFGAEEQIGTNAYAEIFALMKANGLNLIWPAMHEGGYEFSARPENLELARHWGITVGTSHCEPMLRNNCYLAKADKKKWSWVSNRDFLEDYWREGVRRGTECFGRVEHADRVGDVLWTIGMRGIHDGRMPDGKTTEEKIKILEEVFAAQCAMLPEGAPKLFCPYKEVLPIFNSGLKVPEDVIIMWTNDNFGYIRRLGGNHSSPQALKPSNNQTIPQGIYWHLSYHGHPHGYIHLCTTPPAFMWYELVAKCWENGVRDVWMVNAGDVFQTEILLDAYGKFAADPESWGPDAQDRFLSEWVDGFLAAKDAKSTKERIAAHLAEYYNLGFNRKPEHMCVQWSRNLPECVKASLLKRYHNLLNEDMAIERLLQDSTRSTRLKIADEYFRLVGFQTRFLAYAGIIHLEGRDKDYARSVIDPLYERWDKLDGGKWSRFWCDTIDENGGMRQPTTANRWSSQMQWPWNEPDDPARKDRRGESRNDYVATAYAWERAKGLEEPTWIEPVARERSAKGGEWVNVAGLGTSGNALALLPVKPGVGDGALLKFDLNHLPTHSNTHPLNQSSLVLQFLPDFALWPGLKLGVKVSFDAGEAKYVEVPRSDSNIGEKDSVRAVAVQDNFIRVEVPIPSGAKTATITAVDPGVVIDRVGVRPVRQASGSGERIIPQGANVAPNGDRLEVTSKCLRLNGRALIPIMGEMHYSRVPRDEWAKSLATMKEGGVSIVSTYVFWNHHEWKEGEWDFSGNRDLSAFLGEVKKAGLWAVVRIGPWAHGECREGGFPDWLVDKAFEWANGDAKKARQILRSRDARFLGETKKLFERVHSEVAPHLWKNGGPVIGVQLENESRGPWPYYQALKKLAVEAGYDVPMYTRTGWPRLNGPETTFGEMIPLYGDYAEGFWDRELKSMPSGYKSAFEMRPARTSSVIATEQLGAQKAEDAKGAEKYPYFTCELGGGMASSYHRRLVMEPMDAFALAVVKLGSGSNLPGFYMYHGGSNPTEYGVNMAESQRGRFTNYNDLPVVSYEFMAPVSEFGEPQYAYWMIRALADFCRENAEELAVAEPVFVNKNETRRGRFIFHNDYVRRLRPDGECWIGVEKDGRIERLVDGRLLVNAEAQRRRERREKTTAMCVESLKVLKPAGTPPPVAVGPNGVATMPEESAWDAAAEYEVPFKAGDTMLEIAYVGDMARLYADGVLVQDDFWKGLPIRYALRRLPKGTKRLVLKVLPRGAGWEDKVYVDRARAGSSADDIARYEAVGELARDPAEKPVDAPKDMKLVLCMGQSNMSGRAKMSDADREVVPRAYKLARDGRWVAAKAPYHFDRAVAAVGPVDEFVRRYLADHPGETIGVVPCAVGGSPFYSWDPPPKGERKGVKYAKALERAKVAQANGKFIAILWHQGETDAAKAKDETGLNESYPKDFARMMSELRKELGEGDIPVIAGEIGRWMRPDGDHAARINPGIGKIPSLLPRSAVVSSEGLANQDRHHFDREAQRILGGRYYDAFKSL